MRKGTIIAVVILTIATIVVAVFSLNSRNQSVISENTPEPVKISAIEEGITEGLKEWGLPYEGRDIVVENVEYIDTEWVVVEATLLDEPLESEARLMTYVFERAENESLRCIAFSGDGLTEESFPTETPARVVEEVIRRW